MTVKAIPHTIGEESIILTNVWNAFVRDNELIVRVRGENFDRSISLSENDVDFRDA